MSLLKLTVNGNPHTLDVPESRYLAEVLRYDLGLTGTKIGCNEAECGICTVLVNGTPVNSCIHPAFKAQGAEITTIEGLGEKGQLHPVQQAFLDHGAVQCGFCTPGLIMTAAALIDEKQAANEPVTEADVKVALKDTYCRCTGYQSVINAILQASGQDVKPYIPETKKPCCSVGRALPNPDSMAKITGTAMYTDDFHFPGMLFARTKRSDVAHGRILSINTSDAEKLPGVRAVLTHHDIPGRKNHGLVSVDWPALCYDKVRYVGDAVAIVAADSADVASAALDLIQVEYETLPVINDPIQAAQPDAAVLHEERPDGNLLKHIKVRKGSIAAGFEEADVIVEKTYRTPMTEQMFLEPECSVGVPKGYDPARFGGKVDPKVQRGIHHKHDKTTIYCGTQIPYLDRDQTAAALGVANEEVRIVAALMGGGFGGKEDIAAQIHVEIGRAHV
jgi:xanthine dehydrogenase molybdenum-binding subunit